MPDPVSSGVVTAARFKERVSLNFERIPKPR